MRQRDRLLQYLKQHETLSSLRAREELAIIDLPKRVSELKSDGILLDKTWVTRRNKYGEPVTFIRYSLPKILER